jgi:hypothetical protein
MTNWSVHTDPPPGEEGNTHAPMTWTDVGYVAVIFVCSWILVGFIVWAVWSNL